MKDSSEFDQFLTEEAEKELTEGLKYFRKGFFHILSEIREEDIDDQEKDAHAFATLCVLTDIFIDKLVPSEAEEKEEITMKKDVLASLLMRELDVSVQELVEKYRDKEKNS